MCVLPQSHIPAAPAADARFGRGSGTSFGPGKASVRKAASCWRDGVSKVLHEAPRDGPGCPKSSPKLTFGVPGRHFLRPKCHNAVCTKNILFTMFLPH